MGKLPESQQREFWVTEFAMIVTARFGRSVVTSSRARGGQFLPTRPRLLSHAEFLPKLIALTLCSAPLSGGVASTGRMQA
jgi:hypothetical protein